MKQIFIIEDEQQDREDLAQIIESNKQYKCSGAFPNCESALKKLIDEKPDLVLLDIFLPGLSGVDGAIAIKALSPKTPILMLSRSDNENHIFNSLKNGASGYLLKTDGPQKILKSIDDVLNGRAAMSMSIANKVNEYFKLLGTEIKLTKHQREVLLDLGSGKSNKAIADDRNLSVHAIKYHTNNIYNIMHVSGRLNAVLTALKKGLIDIDDLDFSDNPSTEN
ncbi:MAG: DNA-binding response regulator [Calditrichaeota bacterium]|nr:MAG: DNA-binding response regulator [Calditrichota bacterium]MBL1208036.1 DNA-binding response regulator [Calditrichota bacterium]NOG47871.1 response regulator transcription factor [Calditrichota bacterium]